MKLRQILESQNIQNVFHLTSLGSAISIVNDNKLNASSPYKLVPVPYISTTRNKNFSNKTHGTIAGNDIIFVIDSRKLSNNYKHRPVSDSEYGDEMEEAWYGNRITNDKGISNFNKYVIGIELNDKLKHKLKHKINLVRNQKWNDHDNNVIKSELGNDFFDQELDVQINIIKKWFSSKGINVR